MKGLKLNKATGCDLPVIPPRLVQQSAEVLSQPFSTLFNYVLDHATVPSQWKLGEISPMHRKDYNQMKSNYRLISILPSLSKMFEKLIHNRVGPYLEDLYNKLVFAYRDSMCIDFTEATKQWKPSYKEKLVFLIN